jgi:hypothetical protein
MMRLIEALDPEAMRRILGARPLADQRPRGPDRELLADRQTFWRKDGHLAAEGFAYREVGPNLMLMAFLQRVVNGGGRIERGYGLGRARSI